MDAVVIPWFLALTSFAALNNTDIRTNPGPIYETESDHGLEYVYDVEYDFILTPEISIQSYYNKNLTTTLRCRARNESVLSCISGEGIMDIADVKLQTRFQMKINPAKEYFEIDYNEAGVTSLRVPHSPLWTMDYENNGANNMRIIGSLFNVGTDFDKHQFFSFTTNETSFLGACETVVSVVESSCPENVKRGNFKLRSIFDDSLGDSFLLRKRTNTRKCDCHYDVSLLDGTNNGAMIITSSHGEMRVCSDFFESTIIVEGKKVNVKEGGKAYVFRQVNKIRLRSVERAVEELPPFVPNSVVDTIYLHKSLQSNNLED